LRNLPELTIFALLIVVFFLYLIKLNLQAESYCAIQMCEWYFSFFTGPKSKQKSFKTFVCLVSRDLACISHTQDSKPFSHTETFSIFQMQRVRDGNEG